MIDQILGLPSAAYGAVLQKMLRSADNNGARETTLWLLNLPMAQHYSNYDGNRLLLRAIWRHDSEMISQLLKHKAVLDNIAVNNNAVFRQAAFTVQLDVVNTLLGYPEVVEDIAAKNNEALRYAAAKGDLDVVNVLLQYPAVLKNIAARNNEALRYAAAKGDLDVVNVLLQYPAVVQNIAANNNEALRYAAAKGHLDVVNVLLQYPAVVDNIAANDNEALRAAASWGYLSVVNVLLQYDAVLNDISARDNEALRQAACFGYIGVVNALLVYPNIAVNTYEALRSAASNCGKNYPLIRRAKIAAPDYEKHCNIEVVERLLEVEPEHYKAILEEDFPSVIKEIRNRRLCQSIIDKSTIQLGNDESIKDSRKKALLFRPNSPIENAKRKRDEKPLWARQNKLRKQNL